MTSKAVLLCGMGQDEITDNSDIHKSDKIRRANAQKTYFPALFLLKIFVSRKL